MPHFPKPWFRASRNTWYVTIDGHQHNLGSDRDRAFEFYRELFADRGLVPEGAMTVRGLGDAFLAWARRELSADTAHDYQRLVTDFTSAFTPSMLARAVVPSHLEEWVARHAESWGPSAKRKAITVVVRLFNWGVKRRYLRHSPLGVPEKPQEQVRDYFIEEVDYLYIRSLLERKPQHLDLVTFLWETGCRPQEAYAFEKRHFDARARTLSLERRRTKGRKAVRVVYLGETAFHLVARRCAALVLPTAPVFVNSKGRRWTADAVLNFFDHLVQALSLRDAKASGLVPSEGRVAQIMYDFEARGGKSRKSKAVAEAQAWRELATPFDRPLCPYSFRHGTAVRWLRAGLDSLVVAKLLGHKNAAMISTVYGHWERAGTTLLDALDSLPRSLPQPLPRADRDSSV